VDRDSLVRQLRRQELWNGNREPALWTILTDREHIVRWAWNTHHKGHARVAHLMRQRPDLSTGNTRRALPAPFVIVAKFYDIESGRNDLEFRGQGDAHKRFDIPIAATAASRTCSTKPNARTGVAVASESIERVARVSYFSTKIEYELCAVSLGQASAPIR
jgi:hypothetical protein